MGIKNFKAFCYAVMYVYAKVCQHECVSVWMCKILHCLYAICNSLYILIIHIYSSIHLYLNVYIHITYTCIYYCSKLFICVRPIGVLSVCLLVNKSYYTSSLYSVYSYLINEKCNHRTVLPSPPYPLPTTPLRPITDRCWVV